MLRDMLIARQAGLITKLECDDVDDLARLGRQSLALFRETQAVLTGRVDRFGAETTEELPSGDAAP